MTLEGNQIVRLKALMDVASSCLYEARDADDPQVKMFHLTAATEAVKSAKEILGISEGDDAQPVEQG